MVVCRITKQIPWPDRMLAVSNVWRHKSKKIMMRDLIPFINRKGKKFDWDNDELSDFEVIKDQS